MSNLVTEKLTSLQLEKEFLGGLLKFPKDIVAETDLFLKEGDFSNTLHKSIYSITRNLVLAGQEPNRTIIAQKVKELNLSFKDDISPFDYIENLGFTQINLNGTIATAKNLVKLRIRREIYTDANDVQSFITGPKCTEKTVAEIVAEVDNIYNKRINAITTDEDPIDLFAGLEQHIKNIAANPVEEVGLVTPFPIYNSWFGGLKAGDGAYLYSARLSEGKSVWMFNLAKGIALLNKCKVLYLDTEMSLKLNMERAGAAEMGVNPWFLQNGQWVKNHDLAKKVTNAFPEFKKYKGLFFHKYVPNKSAKELLGIARKWYLKEVGRGNKAFVILDYLKITGMDADANRNEWQDFGDRVCYMNEFGAMFDVNVAIAAQQNRQGNQNGVKSTGSETIGGSDRIAQFARFGAIISRKSLDEVADYGPRFGTHMLTPFKYSRDQGKEDYSNNSYVKVTNDHDTKVKYVQNFINLKIHYYDMKEEGTLNDIIKHKTFTKKLTDKDGDDKKSGKKEYVLD